MDILSSDEDTDLYTDQDTTKNVRNSQRGLLPKERRFRLDEAKYSNNKVKRRTKTQHQLYKLNKEQSSWNTIIDNVPNNIPHPKQ